MFRFCTKNPYFSYSFICCSDGKTGGRGKKIKMGRDRGRGGKGRERKRKRKRKDLRGRERKVREVFGLILCVVCPSDPMCSDKLIWKRGKGKGERGKGKGERGKGKGERRERKRG